MIRAINYRHIVYWCLPIRNIIARTETGMTFFFVFQRKKSDYTDCVLQRQPHFWVTSLDIEKSFIAGIKFEIVVHDFNNENDLTIQNFDLWSKS